MRRCVLLSAPNMFGYGLEDLGDISVFAGTKYSNRYPSYSEFASKDQQPTQLRRCSALVGARNLEELRRRLCWSLSGRERPVRSSAPKNTTYHTSQS